MNVKTAPLAHDSITLHSARSFEDLLGTNAASSSYDYSLMFSGEGWLARRRAKRRLKLLQALDAKLRGILRSNEHVYFATTGTTVSLSEQFLVGWMAMYLNRRALVFTTERILLLQIDRKNRPLELVSQIPVASIASIKGTWTGVCRVKLLDREVYNFQSIPSADRKFVAKLLGDITQGTASPFSRGQGIEHLCPRCYAVEPAHASACSKCAVEFKSANKAGLLSLVVPGFGDWYLGHRSFAVLEMLGCAFLWLGFVVLPLLGVEDPELGAVDAAYWITAAAILGFSHAVDAVMTRHFARKGHHAVRARS
jgi:hypothetical protein